MEGFGAWVVDVRPLEGHGVMARIYDDADVGRMMDAGGSACVG